MKDVSAALEQYLHSARNMISCDLFILRLSDGKEYFYTNFDRDIAFDDKVYLHNELLLKRQQVKLHDTVVVDTMTITIYADNNTHIGTVPLKVAAHNGTLDRSYMTLKRCFFNSDGTVLGVMGVFGGNLEVKKCGGLSLELTIKAKTQGLSQEFPRRKYYPQGAYSTTDGVVSSTDTNTDSCLIAPFVPLKEVLL